MYLLDYILFNMYTILYHSNVYIQALPCLHRTTTMSLLSHEFIKIISIMRMAQVKLLSSYFALSLASITAALTMIVTCMNVVAYADDEYNISQQALNN